MHEYISFNHQTLFSHEPALTAISSATLYGKGIFTTIAIYNSEPFLWEKHWTRLLDNASRVGLDFNFAKETVKESLAKLILKNKMTNGRARLTFFDESAQGIWALKNNKKTALLITTADFRPSSEELKLTVSPYRVNSTSPLANIKSCNYLENILAFEQAKKDGFDEAIRLNERGEIVSACLANIFWVKNDEIFTPGLRTGCLAGTMRAYILEKYKVSEVQKTLEILHDSDGIFITSAGLGIKQIFFEKKQAKLLKFVDLLPFAK